MDTNGLDHRQRWADSVALLRLWNAVQNGRAYCALIVAIALAVYVRTGSAPAVWAAILAAVAPGVSHLGAGFHQRPGIEAAFVGVVTAISVLALVLLIFAI